MNKNNYQKQRLGYIIMGGSLIPMITVLIMYIYASYPPIILLGGVVPAAALLAIGYWRLSSGDKGVSGDNQNQIDRNRAGNWAFIVLISVISIDAFFGIIPAKESRIVYLAIGGVTALLARCYYKYI